MKSIRPYGTRELDILAVGETVSFFQCPSVYSATIAKHAATLIGESAPLGYYISRVSSVFSSDLIFASRSQLFRSTERSELLDRLETDMAAIQSEIDELHQRYEDDADARLSVSEDR